MSLVGLPNELLQVIAVYCGVEGGGLARTNKRLYDNTNDILWRSAIEDEYSFSKITMGSSASGNLKTMKKAATYGANFDLIHHCPNPLFYGLKIYSLLETRFFTTSQKLSEFWAAPLHLAVMYGNYDIVEWLLTVQRVDIETPGRLPCVCRGIRDHDTLLFDKRQYRFDSHPIWSALHFAICSHRTSIAYLLLSHNACKEDMFYSSVIEDEPDLRSRCMGPLTHYGVTLDRYRGLTENMTTLHTAARHGPKLLVTYLVQSHGMDINEPDDWGFGPIYYALLSHDNTMVEHLLTLGADLDRHDLGWERVHRTPIIWALSHGKNAAVSRLLDAGAKTWWTGGGTERKAILNHEIDRHYTYPSTATDTWSRTQSTEAMRKLMERTLEEQSSESTGGFKIASEVWPALKALARMAPQDWNPSTSFSNSAKKVLHSVIGDITNSKSPCYLGRSDKQFERLVQRWKRDWISAPTEENGTE